MSYIATAMRSPCVVPSLDSSFFFLTITANGFEYELYIARYSAGHRKSFAHRQLAAHRVEVIIPVQQSASISLSSNFSRSEGMAYSKPHFRRKQSCLLDPSSRFCDIQFVIMWPIILPYLSDDHLHFCLKRPTCNISLELFR